MPIGRSDDPQNPCRVAVSKVSHPFGADRGTHLGQRHRPRKQAGHTTATAPAGFSLPTPFLFGRQERGGAIAIAIVHRAADFVDEPSSSIRRSGICNAAFSADSCLYSWVCAGCGWARRCPAGTGHGARARGSQFRDGQAFPLHVRPAARYRARLSEHDPGDRGQDRALLAADRDRVARRSGAALCAIRGRRAGSGDAVRADHGADRDAAARAVAERLARRASG